MAKKWVGIAAVNITGHSIGQKVGLYFDSRDLDKLSDYDKSTLGDLKLSIPHNVVNVDGVDMISLGSVKTADGNDKFISDRLSGYATSFVDVANDPYILKIIPSDMIVGTAMLMERIGVGELTPYFLAQPIITEYVNHLDRIGSRSLFSRDNRDYIESQFPIREEVEYDLSNEFVRNEDGTVNFEKSKSNLINLIEKDANRPSESERSEEFNVKQRAIFNEFLKLAKLAQLNFKFSQAYNYDTTRVRNYEGFKRKMARTTSTKETNIISSIDKVMDGTFIGDQMKLIREELRALGSIMKLDSKEIEIYIDDVLTPFYNDEYMSQDDFNYVSKKLKNSFLDYIIQTRSELIQPSDYKNLFIGKNNVASRLLKLKDKYPNLNILKNLIPYSSLQENGPVTVSLKVKPTDAIDVDRHIGMMLELKELEPEFYNDLIKLSILQGTADTNISISSIIPVEDRAAIIAPVIDSLVPSAELETFNREGLFYRNNFRDDSIVPQIKPMYRSVQDIGDSVQPDYAKLDTFTQVLTHGITKGSGKILTLNNEYSFMNEADRDFVKMNRYQYVSGMTQTGVIDITTGKSMSVSNFNQLVNLGKLSKYEKVGYKKVKSRDGVPLTIQKKVGKTMSEFSVFKMVNLYGDGRIVAEYPKAMTPSVFDNNTYKVEEELTDEMIIDMLSGEPTSVPEKTAILPENVTASEIPQTVVTPTDVSSELSETRTIQVNQYKISILPDGRMFFSNGKEVTDQTIKNKVNIRKELQDGTLRISTYNKSEYFVLLDNRILGSGKTNLGKETVTDPTIIKNILMKATLYKKTC